MDTNPTFSKNVRRALMVAGAALVLASCGEATTLASDPTSIIGPADEVVVHSVVDAAALDSIEPDGLQPVEVTVAPTPAPTAARSPTTAPEPIATTEAEPTATTEAVPTPTTEAVLTPSTEAVPTPTTAAVPTPTAALTPTTAPLPPNSTPIVTPDIATPESVGATAFAQEDLFVATSVGDPLNVRRGPGVEYDIIDELEHLAGGIDSSHSVQIAPNVIWSLVSLGGEERGWVHSDFLITPSPTASCVAQTIAATDISLELTSTSDIDFDQLDDVVEVYTGLLLDGSAVMWVEVQFGNGGTASGVAATANSLLHFPDVMEMKITRLNFFPGGSPAQEIAVTIAQGASHSGWGVVSLEGCEFVQTTLDGETFTYGIGASAIASSAGCGYDVHGETTFFRATADFNSETWSHTQYELRGTEWTEYDTTTGAGFVLPQGSFGDCGAVNLNT